MGKSRKGSRSGKEVSDTDTVSGFNSETGLTRSRTRSDFKQKSKDVSGQEVVPTSTMSTSMSLQNDTTGSGDRVNGIFQSPFPEYVPTPGTSGIHQQSSENESTNGNSMLMLSLLQDVANQMKNVDQK